MHLTTSDSRKVIVVGAGLAGLTAARRLTEAGVDVTVLEARDRVGGRTCTVRDGFADGQHGDLGGELVTTDHRAFAAVCTEVGVELSDEVWLERPDLRAGESALEGYLVEGHVIVEGALLTGARFAAVDDEIKVALRDVPPAPHEVIAQWVRRAGLSAVARRAMAGIGRMPVQHDPMFIDTHYLTGAHMRTIRRVVGGSQRLADELARGLDVRLESQVRCVRQAGGRVQVEMDSGQRLVAHQVVVAVPAFVLPTIGFDPPLAANVSGAIAAMQRAQGGKVIAQYAEGDAVRAALSHAVFTDGPLNTAWVSNHYVTSGPAVVSGFVCGADRHVLEDDVTAFAALDEVVSIAVGGPVTRLTGQRKNWSEDPLALGMGATTTHSTRTQVVAQLATPERRVHFAGDQTDVEMAGSMEGAVRSGLRVADEILRTPQRIPLNEIDARLVRP